MERRFWLSGTSQLLNGVAVTITPGLATVWQKHITIWRRMYRNLTWITKGFFSTVWQKYITIWRESHNGFQQCDKNISQFDLNHTRVFNSVTKMYHNLMWLPFCYIFLSRSHPTDFIYTWLKSRMSGSHPILKTYLCKKQDKKMFLQCVTTASTYDLFKWFVF